MFGVNLRPFVREMLSSLKDRFNLFIFTQAEDRVAEKLIEIIEKDGPLFTACFYRSESTELSTMRETFFVLDFTVFENINMEESLLVDSSLVHFAFQLGNGIPVLPFYDNTNDTELKILIKFLMSVSEDETLKDFCRKNLELENQYEEINEENYSELVFQRYLGCTFDSSCDSIVM